MADDAEITVEIDEEVTPPAEGQQVKVETKPDPLIAELQAQKETLVQQADRERTEKLDAIRRANSEAEQRAAAEQQLTEARGEVSDTRLTAIEQGQHAAQTASDAGEAEYAAAMEAGDWKRAAKAQVGIAAAQANLQRYNEAKADVEAQRAASVVETRREQPQTQQPSDPVEAFLARRSDPAKAWLRAHPEEARALAYNDPRRGAKINAAHNDALAEGATLDSPEYFAHVEKFLGLTKAATNGAGRDANGKFTPTKRAASAPVAPVQPSASGTNGGGDVVRLTPGEARAAQDGTLIWNYDDPSPQKKFKKGDSIGIQEMARRKLAMQKQGLYDKSFTEN